MMLLKRVMTWLRGTGSTVWAMKYLPVLGTFAMTLHCALLLLGVNLDVAEHVTGFSSSSSLMFFLLSKQFHFCRLHKIMIGYLTLMQFCILSQEHNLFGDSLTVARLIMLSIGLVLCLWGAFTFDRHGRSES